MNLNNKRDLTIWLNQQARKRRKTLSIPEQVRSILNKYGATMLLPGVAEPILGPELVGSAWVDASAAPATATFSDGVLTLNATGVTSRGRTSITTVANRTYRVTARKLNAGSDCTLDVGTSAGGSQLSVNNTVGTSGVSITFVATTTQTWLNFYRGATSVTDVTDISVREILGYNHTRFGYQAGNYRESTGQTLAAADQQVGFGVDAARSAGVNLAQVTTVSAVPIGGPSLTEYSTGATLEAGKWYEISATVSNFSGSNTIGFNSSPRLVGASTANYISGNGIAREIGRCGISGPLTLFTRSTNTCNFSNISVRELPGIHASQSTSGFQPVLRNASGIQSWQFDGTDDRLSLSAVPFQMADDHFVVAGFAPATLHNGRIFDISRAGNVTPLIALGVTSAGAVEAVWRDDAAVLVTAAKASAFTAGQRVVATLRKQGSTRSLRVDSVLSGSSTLSLGATTLDAAALGIRVANTTLPYNGHQHVMFIGKGAPSDSELLALERFAALYQGRQL